RVGARPADDRELGDRRRYPEPAGAGLHMQQLGNAGSDERPPVVDSRRGRADRPGVAIVIGVSDRAGNVVGADELPSTVAELGVAHIGIPGTQTRRWRVTGASHG